MTVVTIIAGVGVLALLGFLFYTLFSNNKFREVFLWKTYVMKSAVKKYISFSMRILTETAELRLRTIPYLAKLADLLS